jgi:hypothetical protein
VVNTKDTIVGEWEEVACLPVAIVDDGVKKCEWTETYVLVVNKVNRRLHTLMFDPELHSAWARWSVAQDRRRDHIDFKRRREDRGCDLAPGEGASWKVPEWRLAANWLVHNLELRLNADQLTEECRITRLGKSTDRLKVGGCCKEAKRLLTCNRRRDGGEHGVGCRVVQLR